MTEVCYSTGEAAKALGISRDALIAALRAGAPEASQRLAGRRMFNGEDIERLRAWFAGRGRVLPAAAFDAASAR